MKKVFLPAISSLLILVVLSISAIYFWRWVNSPVGSYQSQGVVIEKHHFIITQGETVTQIIDSLADLGLIRSPIIARLYLRYSGIGQSLSPGAYWISRSQSLPQIFNQLSQGPQDIWITFPEGWRREQMGLRLSEKIGDTFKLPEFLSQTNTLEGQLFPDTYLISQSADASSVVSILTSNFHQKTQLDLSQTYQINLGSDTISLTGNQVLILASLVEREANNSSDRPIIAGVLLNRLSIGMPLQVDATLQYAAGTLHCRTNEIDCSYWQPISGTSTPSLYNTYQHTGLPPTPISNPGLESINAVLRPLASSYFYYLTGNDGITYYASTLSQHNANVDKYLKN